jgi:CheY-like chemotaxis protein
MNGISIRLIDDSPQVREVLRTEGYTVIEAVDGREGVRLYREHRPAPLITDVVMPENDGIETVCGILVQRPRGGHRGGSGSHWGWRTTMRSHRRPSTGCFHE